MKRLRGTAWVLLQFTHRDLAGRFAGSNLGLAWAFINPVAQLLTFAFVFSTVLQARVAGDRPIGFTAFLALTLWPWMAFSEAVQRASQSIVQNAALVKRTRMRHDLLVYASVLSSYVLHMVGYSMALAWIAFTEHHPLHLAGAPRIFISLGGMFMLASGLALMTASIQVFLRDLEQALAPVLSILFYLSPILYSATQAPPWIQRLMQWHPIAIQVESLRAAWLDGISQPSSSDWAVFAASAAVWWLGHLLFQRLSPHFEEAL